MLIAARVVQGLGAAGIMSMNSAMIRFSYPRAMLGRAVGFTAIVVALASAAGPSIAAAILSVADWPWLFAVNVPLGVAALIVGQFALPRIAPAPRRFDALAAVLNALTFGALFMGVEGITEGTRPVLSAFETAAGLAAGAALVLRSLGQPRPLAPVDLLRIPLFAMAMATSVASFLAQNFAFVALPFLIEYAFHRTPVETGLLMTPWSLAVAAVAPISGRLADRYPGGIIAAAGLALLGAGLVALALLPAAPSAFDIGWRMVIGGVGFALFQSPNNRQLLSSAPTERAGSAGGMLATARLTGQTVGAVLVALVFRAAVGPPSPKILLIAAASAFVAAVLSWLKPDRG
jgi:DHA2 family multidrug resistance protein-like MFS transporter